MMEFGVYLRQLRKKAGIGQHAMAAAIGLANTFMCDVEKGRRMPALDRLAPLAKVLNTSLHDLVCVWVRSRGGVEIPVKNDVQAIAVGLLVQASKKFKNQDWADLREFLQAQLN
jgi:transcriptional regulator with XRE-family HTH domain